MVEVSQLIVSDIGEQDKAFLTEKVMLSSDFKTQTTFIAAKFAPPRLSQRALKCPLQGRENVEM